MRNVVLLALIAGALVGGACAFWKQGAEEDVYERADRAHAQLQETIDALAGGRAPEDIPPPDVPWPARNFHVSGLIAFTAALMFGRIWLFMVRLENRPRA